MEVLIVAILGILYLVLLKWKYHIYDNESFYMQVPPIVVERALRIADIRIKDTLFILGSGDGRFVIASALKGKSSTGIEIDRVRSLYSKAWIWLLNLKNAQIKHKSVFKTSLKSATVVVVLLRPKTHNKLIKKLRKELKKGSRVILIGHMFEEADWKPKRIVYGEGVFSPISLYTV